MSQIEVNMNRIPRKMLFLPEPKISAGRGIFKKSSARIKRLLWHKTRLYFVCTLSHQPGESGKDRQGYELSFDTKLLRGLKPLIALSAIVMKAALGAAGIPLPPLPPGVTSMMYVDALSEFVCEELEGAAEDGLDAVREAAERDTDKGTGTDTGLHSGAVIDGSLQQVYEMLLR